QIFVQVLASGIQVGTVVNPLTVAFPKDGQCPFSGIVIVQVAPDLPVMVQIRERAFKQGHRIEDQIVLTAADAEYLPRKEIDETLKQVAGKRAIADNRNILGRQTPFHEPAP